MDWKKKIEKAGVILFFLLFITAVYSGIQSDSTIKHEESLWETGNGFFFDQQYDKALIIYDKLFALRSKNAGTNLLYIYAIKGDRENEIRTSRALALLFPWNFKLRGYLASLYPEYMQNLYSFTVLHYITPELCIVMALLLGLLSIMIPGKARRVLVIAAILFLGIFWVVDSKLLNDREIMTIRDTRAYEMPLPDAGTYFPVREFTFATLKKTFKEFAEVNLQNGKTGWIPIGDITKIFGTRNND